jgi:hypothetical protein
MAHASGPWAAGLVLAILGAAPRPTAACDSSSCALILKGSAGDLEKGRFRIDLSLRHIDMSAPFAGGTETREVVRPVIDFGNEAVRPGSQTESAGAENFLQLDLTYGFSRTLSVSASIPILAEHSVTHTYVGSAVPGTASVAGVEVPHTTSGVGDVLLGARRTFVPRPGQRLTTGLSVKLPTGPSRARSHVSRLVLDPMVQAGTGAFSIVPSMDYARRLSGPAVDATLSASYEIATVDSRGYRFGNELIVAVTAGRRLVSGLSVSVQAKHHRAARNRYLGEGVASTGGAFWHLTPGLRLESRDGAALYALLQAPVRRYVNEAQLAPRLGVLVGFSIRP